MFFDAYPRFYETSKTSASRGRLNLRYEAIFGENADVFRGARVLDIASHDGRWSLAALKTGAVEVVGIEGREKLVFAARRNLELYGADAGAYRLVVGDVFEVLAAETFESDVVLCLGFLYHTLRYSELLRLIRSVDPRYLIVDSHVLPGVKRPYVQISLDRTQKQANAVPDAYSYHGLTIVGIPSSISALELLLEAYDFEIERLSDWGSLIRDNPDLKGVGGYACGARITARCASHSARVATPRAE